MKILNYWLLGLGMLLAISCTKTATTQKQEKNNAIPVVDVTKSYPKKEITLQDIADVEYIPLETRDDVLLALGDYVAYCSDEMIISGSRRTGDIYIFDGQGNFLGRFNHKGQSGEEYSRLWKLLYDEKRKELYAFDAIFRHRALVYDLQGKYKRTLTFTKTAYYGSYVIDFDSESLFCYDELIGEISIEEATKNPFKFIDKQTGAVLDSIVLPFHKRVNPSIKTGAMSSVRPAMSPIVSNNEELVLSEISCDTIFLLSKDKKLTPLVVRTPAITNQAKPDCIFQVLAISPEYIFAEVVQLKPNGMRGYPPANSLAINRKTFEVSQCKLQNSDALGVWGTASKRNTRLIDAATLIEALEDGKLKGKLKEIAEKLKEDGNPVLMKVTFKK